MASRIITICVLAAGVLLLGLMFYQVIAPFLLPLFLAAILTVLCRPYYQRLLPRVWNRPDLAAGITTAVIMLILITPVVIGTLIGAVQIAHLAQGDFLQSDWSRGLERLWSDVLEPPLKSLETRYPEQFQVQQIKRELSEKSAGVVQSLAARTFSWASSTVGTVMSLMVSGGMFLVAFYYFLADGPALVSAAETLIPVPVEHQRQLRDQFCKVVRAVVLATFLAAFAQGFATAVALQVVGMGHFFVFLIAATIASLIPLAGTWMVWGPCAAWLAFQGHYTAAIGLAFFGIVVVGLLDNVIRTYVLNSDAQLHPLLAFVSVLGALQVMGLWGIFFGPIIASCLYALVQIFNSELQHFSAVAANSSVAAPITGSPPVASLPPTGTEQASPENKPPPETKPEPRPSRKQKRRR